jgi:D-arabinose 1-dehydrogenase-like Zn-dependent alcohol dehydrogenase
MLTSITGIDTYGAKYEDGTIAMGGYSSHIRAHEYFTFKIPDNISTDEAAPMMCAGLTVYSPLVRLGAGPGKKVAMPCSSLLHWALRSTFSPTAPGRRTML